MNMRNIKHCPRPDCTGRLVTTKIRGTKLVFCGFCGKEVSKNA